MSRTLTLLCQRIAQRFNREEGPGQGKFWQNRFKAVRLLDEEAVLACAAYVDLNPIRAAVAETLEGSHHTSVRRRIEALEKADGPVAKPRSLSGRERWHKFRSRRVLVTCIDR